MPCQTKLMWKYNWNRSLAFLELFNSTVEKRQKKVFKIICSLSLVMSGWCGSFKRELMWHFFLGQSTALTWRASQAHTLFLFPSHFFLFFFQTPPFSLSHLYPHISCSPLIRVVRLMSVWNACLIWKQMNRYTAYWGSFFHPLSFSFQAQTLFLSHMGDGYILPLLFQNKS